MALLPSTANMITGGISIWQVTDLDHPDVAYYYLPLLGQGKLDISSVKTTDWSRRFRVPSRQLNATAQFYAAKTEANFIALLPNLALKRTGHKITTVGGKVFSSNAPIGGGAPAVGGNLGVTWKVISDKDMDDYMYIEITGTRTLLHSEHDGMLTSGNAPVNGLATATDTFYNLGLITTADFIPSGLATISLDTSPNTTWPDVVQNFRNVKFTAELLPFKNESHGRITGRTVQFTLETEALEVTEVEYLKWTGILQRLNSMKLAFVGGPVLTLTTQIGLTVEMLDEKDMEDYSYIKLAAQGACTLANFAALWS